MTDTLAASSGLRLGERAPEGRPFLALNMIATVDGRAVIDGRSGPIGDAADRELFHGLRTQADAVMCGARTATVEGYGPLVKSEELAERRVVEGLDPNPLAVIVSGALALNPSDVPLLQDPASRVVIITHRDGELDGIAADVGWIRVPAGQGSMLAAMQQLRADHGVRSVMCEGGPTLNRSLLADGVVDQLFLSIGPKLVAGEPPFPIVRGPGLDEPADLWLLSCHEAEDSLFLRYGVRRG